MNRAVKDATVKRFYYESHDQSRQHLVDFISACNFGRRLKTQASGPMRPYARPEPQPERYTAFLAGHFTASTARGAAFEGPMRRGDQDCRARLFQIARNRMQ